MEFAIPFTNSNSNFKQKEKKNVPIVNMSKIIWTSYSIYQGKNILTECVWFVKEFKFVLVYLCQFLLTLNLQFADFIMVIFT